MIVDDLRKLANPDKAKILQKFFKTGKGEYGEGDIFLGLTVPEQRKIAQKYRNLTFSEIQELLSSPIHEFRLTALIILTLKYKKAEESEREKIVNFYLKNLKNVNNWDLVDLSAPNILGEWFFDKDKKILYQLAVSKNLWERRIAILSTFGFIRKNVFLDTLKIAEILLFDKHGLIHKAVGWMLREVGKRGREIEFAFLKKYSRKMPRAMLRYAIEKFNEKERAIFLKENKITT